MAMGSINLTGAGAPNNFANFNGLSTTTGLSGGETFQLMLPYQAKLLIYDQNKEIIQKLNALQIGQQQIMDKMGLSPLTQAQPDLFIRTNPQELQRL
ncbi:MAG: hypothetical protein VKJ04_10925 [Vampirovibrionales bacterium]|nr:hypothetical protein [Vampirovibrionales bacterium]